MVAQGTQANSSTDAPNDALSRLRISWIFFSPSVPMEVAEKTESARSLPFGGNLNVYAWSVVADSRGVVVMTAGRLPSPALFSKGFGVI